MDLQKQQEDLQKEGNSLLSKWKLLEELSKYGKVTVVGSMALGLMTWRDIDIEVQGDISKDDYFEIARYIFNQHKLNDIRLADYRKDYNPGHQKGLYINVRAWANETDKWKLDVWFILPGESKLDEYYRKTKEKLNIEKINAILFIKNAVCQNPKYRKVYSSVDIYKAVLDEGVTNLDQFKEYLAKIGKEL
ncbi:MAG: hypothetical protein C4584_00360 [Armatimonadetes bacterium]|nr:MAG: hypothetical protein C4584_00360 [Armatimonadota bacterium]